MRVLHVLAQLPQKTGSGVYFTNLIDGLKKYSEIEQACLYGTTSDYDISILEKQYEVIFESEELPFPIAGMSDIMPYKNTVYSKMTEEMLDVWQENFINKLKTIRAEFDPDVIVTHHLWILSSLVCDIFPDKEVVAICHNTDIRQAKQHPQMKERYVKNIKKLNKILSLSDKQITDIKEVYDYPVEKIYNLGAGYNDKVFYPLESYEDKENVELVYAGKFDASKGIFELITAFENIAKKHTNITLSLVGEVKEENRSYFSEKIAANNNLKVFNVANQKELADYIRKQDIFILPSYFEGLGLIAVEALGSGLRAVTTNIEGLIEFLGEEINNSEVIEYVEMPTIYDTDKAVEEEKPAFVERLEAALEIQIKRTKTNRQLPKELLVKIKKHSWEEKIKELHRILVEL